MEEVPLRAFTALVISIVCTSKIIRNSVFQPVLFSSLALQWSVKSEEEIFKMMHSKPTLWHDFVCELSVAAETCYDLDRVQKLWNIFKSLTHECYHRPARGETARASRGLYASSVAIAGFAMIVWNQCLKLATQARCHHKALFGGTKLHVELLWSNSCVKT